MRTFPLPLFLLAAIVVGCSPSAPPAAPGASPSPSPSATPIAVTANALVSEYVSNEVRADELFKNKQLRIVGWVSNVGKDISDTPYVTLRSADPLREVQVYFTDSSRLAKLSKGEAVTVVGTCTGMMGNVLVKDAVLE